MRTKYPSVCAVLVVTSDTAFLDLNGVAILKRSYESLNEALGSPTVVVVSSPENAVRTRELLDTNSAKYQLLICDSLEPVSLSLALMPLLENCDSVLIHDASRPLTSPEQFERVLAEFGSGVDAVRPVMPFTETLKILRDNSVIKGTLDRTTVLRIATPELYRVSAIDCAGSDCGWFLPLKTDANTKYVEGNPEGLRINTSADRDLMELYQD